MPQNSEKVLAVFLHQSRRVIEQPSLQEKLTAIAQAVVEAGLYKRVAVQLYQDTYGEKAFGCAGLTFEEEQWLKSHDTLDRTEYERVCEYGSHLGGNIYFVSHDQLYQIIDDPNQYLLASETEWVGEGYWHPDDMLYAPLLASNGTPLGNLTADEPFDGGVPVEGTAALIAPFLALASLLVEQDLERRRDPLTSCFNGSVFRTELIQLAQSGNLAGLFFLDMDNLKRTNDQQGHAAGDRLIQATAQSLQREVLRLFGTQGQLFRLHGDEFVVLLRSGAVPMSVAVQSFLAARDQHLDNLSLGGATRDPGESFWEVLTRAEQAMYKDKWSRKGGQSQ